MGREKGGGKYEKGIEVGVKCVVGFGVGASKTHVYLNVDGSRDAHRIETRAHASSNNGWCLRLKNKMFHVTEFSEVVSFKNVLAFSEVHIISCVSFRVVVQKH